MIEQRLRFEKNGRAIYISHLDLMRTFQRAFMRAGIKVKHTEGYNPHAYVSVALPLGVGTSSGCELLDFGLRDESIPLSQLPELLNKALPEGLTILEAYDGGQKVGKLKYISCEVTLFYDGGVPVGCAEAVSDMFAKSEIVIEKKGKKGVSSVDIKPAIRELKVTETGDSVVISAIISAQNPSLSPDNLISAIKQKCPEFAPDFASGHRIETFDENMVIFR